MFCIGSYPHSRAFRPLDCLDEGDLWDLPTCPAQSALIGIGNKGKHSATTRIRIADASLEPAAKAVFNNGAGRAFLCAFTGGGSFWAMPLNGKAYGLAPNVL